MKALVTIANLSRFSEKVRNKIVYNFREKNFFFEIRIVKINLGGLLDLLNQGFPNCGPRAIYFSLIDPARQTISKQFILIITSFDSIAFSWNFKNLLKLDAMFFPLVKISKKISLQHKKFA